MTRCWIVCCMLVGLIAGPVAAVDRTWNGAADSNFFNDANWDTLAPQGSNDAAFIDDLTNAPAVIAADAGTRSLAGIVVGTLADAGQVVQNGGTLNVHDVDVGFKSYVGSEGAEGIGPSSWIMNGDSVFLYDSPANANNAGYGSDWNGEGS